MLSGTCTQKKEQSNVNMNVHHSSTRKEKDTSKMEFKALFIKREWSLDKLFIAWQNLKTLLNLFEIQTYLKYRLI